MWATNQLDGVGIDQGGVVMGNGVFFVIGMIAAAAVGVAGSYGAQSLLLEKPEVSKAPDTGEAVTSTVKTELASLGERVDRRMDNLAVSVEALDRKVQDMGKSLQALSERVSTGAARSAGAAPLAAPVAAGTGGQAVAGGVVEETVRRVLDEVDKRQKEESTQRREERRQAFTNMVRSRVDEFSKEKGWDAAKIETVKNILDEQGKKMNELSGQNSGGGSPENFQSMRQIMNETRTKLLEVMTEEELTELFGGTGGAFGGMSRRNRGTEGQPPAPGPGQ